MTNTAALRWELAGIAVIFLAGSALHSAFDWTGHWRPIAWFAPVNESVWEHLKLAFWPGILYTMLEYPALIRGADRSSASRVPDDAEPDLSPWTLMALGQVGQRAAKDEIQLDLVVTIGPAHERGLPQLAREPVRREIGARVVERVQSHRP